MNVYDFDKTIYSGDSSLDFYLFCLKSKPSLVRYIPFQLFWLTKYMLGLCDKVSFKENFFSFVRDINTKYAVERFWDKNISKVRPWYIKQKSKTDIIVSASPEFLVSSCMKRFSVGNCICTVVSEEDGTFLTPNCYGAEKLKRFKELYDIFNIDSFYSDSLSDRVMAKNSKKAYLVNRNHIISWNDYVLSNTQKIKNLFYTPEFFRFLFIGIINVFSSTLFSWIFSISLRSANRSFVYGYLLSLTCSYLLNSNFVFRKSLTFTKYIKFCISYIPNFLIQNIIVYIAYDILKFDTFLSYFIAGVIAFPITFILLKLKVFKPN